MKNNNTKSSVISRLNNDWEATITISLPLSALDKLAKRLEAEGLTQAQCLAYAKKNGLVSGEKIGELDAAKILTAFDVVKEFIAREDA